MKNLCRNCKYYKQHYGISEGRVHFVSCGHCVLSCKKKLCLSTIACEKFIPGVSVKDELVTKKFLTRKLLEHILDMAVWDDIEES